MIKIKNTKIFTCDKSKPYHWSKLPKLVEVMKCKTFDLFQAHLSCAHLSCADLSCANLLNANLSYAKLYYANFSYAKLSCADLSHTDLSDANLTRTDLFSADLSHANLFNVNLFNANLSHANLYHAVLKSINDKKVIIEDFFVVQGLGSQKRQTIIFNTNIGIVIQCGCFYGTEKQFLKKVKETHRNNQFAREYKAMIELAKIRFGIGK